MHSARQGTAHWQGIAHVMRREGIKPNIKQLRESLSKPVSVSRLVSALVKFNKLSYFIHDTSNQPWHSLPCTAKKNWLKAAWEAKGQKAEYTKILTHVDELCLNSNQISQCQCQPEQQVFLQFYLKRLLRLEDATSSANKGQASTQINTMFVHWKMLYFWYLCDYVILYVCVCVMLHSSL